MTATPFVPLDHPYFERIQAAHAVDEDPVSTRIAAGIAMDAYAIGHPGSPEAAEQALAGPSGATAVQATLQQYIRRAVGHDQAAEQHSAGAMQAAKSALTTAERLPALLQQSVRLSDGSSQTRAQVQEGHDHRLQAIAARESRGDFEHRGRQPALWMAWGAAILLAAIEAALLVWPVTNASWNDPLSVLGFGCLVILFLFMNEALPRHAGEAIREEREARQAAEELTRVGITTGRAGDMDTGRRILGHVDARFVDRAQRGKLVRCAVLGGIVAVYAVVMFTRIYHLASGLSDTLLFSVLAATLVTAFTAGAPIIITWLWARGNALGDQLREYGAITARSRELQEETVREAGQSVSAAVDAAENARSELARGDQVIAEGAPIIAKGLEKAATVLGQKVVFVPGLDNVFVGRVKDAVLGPPEGNFLAIDRPLRDRAYANIAQANGTVQLARARLALDPPFRPTVAVPNPWGIRTRARAALPNPRFVDPPPPTPDRPVP